MGMIARIATILAPALLLSSCILTPGKFNATLDVRADRTFTFTYVGEVLVPKFDGLGNDIDLDLGDGNDQSGWDDQSSDDDDSGGLLHKIAATRPSGNKNGKAPAEAMPPENNPADDRKMQAVATALSKEYGYRAVKYLGDRKFMVDYAISGRLDHAFLFPFNPDANGIFPFVTVELRGGDRVRIKAPAFGNNGTRGSTAGGLGSLGGKAEQDAQNALDGTFTLTTDAEIVSQNQEDGVTNLPDGRKRMIWTANPQTPDSPAAVLRLSPLRLNPLP